MPVAINHIEKIGSAQVKSSVILAALNSPGITKIKELRKSRDHTENMLKFIGAKIKVKKFKNYNLIAIEGQKDFKAFDLSVPGDISSAMFFIVLTLTARESVLKLKNIGLNPSRTGALTILKKMNAKIKIMNIKNKYGETTYSRCRNTARAANASCAELLEPAAGFGRLCVRDRIRGRSVSSASLVTGVPLSPFVVLSGPGCQWGLSFGGSTVPG